MVDLKARLARVFDGVKFKVDRVSVKGSCRLTDTGTNFTCYFTHPHLMFYFACYATPRSLHKLYGTMSCSAYNSSTSNKAQYTIRVNPMMIGRASVVKGDDERSTTEYEFEINELKESLKTEYLIYLFMMQHWSEKQVDYITLDYQDANKQLFGQEMLKMKRELVVLGLLAADVEPIVGVDLEVRRSSGITRRPGGMVRQDTDYEANPVIKTLNFKRLMANEDNHGDDLLPEAIVSEDDKIIFRLRSRGRRFWRTRLVNAMINSETFYYQQVIMNMPVYGYLFHDLKDNMMRPTTGGSAVSLGTDSESRVISWREFYRYLVSCGLIQHDLAIADVVEHTFDVSNLSLSKSEQFIFDEIVYKITALNDNMHWVLGGAGTGKSFLLAKFSVYFECLSYQVVRLSPTGIASYNIHGETILQVFFGMSNKQKQINKKKLNDHVKFFKKTILFIDKFSIVPKDTIEDNSQINGSPFESIFSENW